MKAITNFISFLCLLNIACAQGNLKKVSEEMIFADPPFKQCHASTIVSVSPKKILAAWFGGSGEGNKDVSIWLAESNHGKWGTPKIIANGVINDTLRYPTWNPVLFKAKNGIVFLFYKAGPSPKKWWGMVMRSSDNGITWSAATRMKEDNLGPIKNKPIQLKDGTIIAGSSVETDAKWMVHMERSVDEGKTWTNIPVDTSSSYDVIQPSILEHTNGRLQILCRSKQGTVVQAWSDDNGITWGKLTKTNLMNPNSGTDAVTLQSGRQLIVYNPDLPGKNWYNGRAKLRVAVSGNGIEWNDVFMLENGTREEFSYPAVIQTSDGKIHITYTYDRKNIKHVVLEEKN